MKKKLSITISILLMMTVFTSVSYAEDSSMSYGFLLQAAESTASATVRPGETFDVELVLQRTDQPDGYTMYAAGCTLSYNADFFTVVSGPLCDLDSEKGVSIIKGTENSEGWQSVTVAIKSQEFEGAAWDNTTKLLGMRLRAEQPGASVIQIKDAAVGTISGSRYQTDSNSVTITVSNTDQASDNSGNSGNTGASSSSDNGQNSSGSTTQSGNAGSSSGGSLSGSAGSGSGSGSNTGSAGGSSGSIDNTENTFPSTGNEPESSSSQTSVSFTDVKASDWYSDAVVYVTEKGLFTGTSEHTFSPDAGMSRAMLVTVLWRLSGSPDNSYSGAEFTDVLSDTWYSKAVSWASENGIVSGISADLFAPSQTVTREQLAAMLYRYASYAGTDTAASGSFDHFKDKNSISGWAMEAVRWASDKGIINGMTADTIAPQATANRAQVAVMLMRYEQIVTL